MARMIPFTKMHGAGNDYIYIDVSQWPLSHPQEQAVRWSAFHTGIGSDGLVLIGLAKQADFNMRIFNADGSEAMMCGNAARCIGKYVYDNGMTRKTEITLETLSGIKHLKLHVKEGQVASVTVDMGIPEIVAGEVDIPGYPYKGVAVSMGNPHLVIFVEDLSSVDLQNVGPELERHSLFPDRVNVEFAQMIAPDKIRMRVWERGSGITMACGTGACATVVAGISLGLVKQFAQVVMDGGALEIAWAKRTAPVYMSGEAVKVFDGEIEE